jgi:hypothetical protein
VVIFQFGKYFMVQLLVARISVGLEGRGDGCGGAQVAHSEKTFADDAHVDGTGLYGWFLYLSAEFEGKQGVQVECAHYVGGKRAVRVDL